VVSEQVELYGSITGEHRIPARPEPDAGGGGDVVPFSRDR
jgi:hypothetical protein